MGVPREYPSCRCTRARTAAHRRRRGELPAVWVPQEYPVSTPWLGVPFEYPVSTLEYPISTLGVPREYPSCRCARAHRCAPRPPGRAPRSVGTLGVPREYPVARGTL